uniref:Coiled-coil domain-containing protein 176 n=1 Tax=Heterorhabditis bacteriophora TaxID=37862 RepID=A0A1I7X6U4_HETBA
MVQDGTLADESTRLDIIEERELSGINSEINNRHAEVSKLADKNGGIGSIAEARQRKEFIRKQREHLAKEADLVKSKICALRTEMEMKVEIFVGFLLNIRKRNQLELEKDCRVRSREKLEGYLKSAEDRYRTKLLSHKEEIIIVNEINSLKRNKDKLELVTVISSAKLFQPRKVLSSSGSYPASYPSMHRTRNSCMKSIIRIHDA